MHGARLVHTQVAHTLRRVSVEEGDYKPHALLARVRNALTRGVRCVAPRRVE